MFTSDKPLQNLKDRRERQAVCSHVRRSEFRLTSHAVIDGLNRNLLLSTTESATSAYCVVPGDPEDCEKISSQSLTALML